MQIDDVSPYSFEERQQHWLDQFAGSDSAQRVEYAELARDAAVAEMLNEQHTMLYAICEKLGIEVARRA